MIGPLVTPLARRRIPKLARETATLDRLSGGRLVLGAGLGSDRSGEFELPGEEPDPRVRAQALDDGLAELQRLWSGAFEPQPVGQIPIWLAARWPNRRPVRRAARFDGLFPIDMPGPEALAELRSEVPPPPFDLDRHESARDGSRAVVAGRGTWCLTGFDESAARGRSARGDSRRPLSRAGAGRSRWAADAEGGADRRTCG